MLYLFHFRVTVRRFHNSDPLVYMESTIAKDERDAVSQVRDRTDYRYAVNVTLERV